MQSAIDLHCHSTASDGALGPSELVLRAYDKGVRTLALTDHDTDAGLPEARQKATELGMDFVNGIEFSCLWRKHTIHVIALNFKNDSPPIRERVRMQAELRSERNQQIETRLEKKGMPNLLQAALRLAPAGIPGRPHFAQAMVDAGYVKDMSEAFRKYLGQGKVGDVKNMWPDLSELVADIAEGGGVAVIAHPRKYNMTLTKLRELIVDFKAAGGTAIEVITSGQKQGDIGLLTDLCYRHDLKASIGSDFHSPATPWVELGRIPSLPTGVSAVWEDWNNPVN